MKFIFNGFLQKSKRIGKKYNYSLLAEIFALLFLGFSEHGILFTKYDRQIVFFITLICSYISFTANE